MTGEPYSAGGIRTTVAATRAATDEQLTSHVARLVAEMRAQGTTSLEIKSGYGLTVHDEARSLARRPRGPPMIALTGAGMGFVMPAAMGAAMDAMALSVALATNGTVRDARGLTSST